METNVIILICILSIIAASFIFSTIFLLTKKEKLNHYEAILFFLEIDLNKWRVRKNNIIWNKNLENNEFDSYFRKKIGIGWIDLSKLFETIGHENEKKWLEAIEFCIQNKSSKSVKSKIQLKTIDNKGFNTYFFDINFFYVNNKTIHAELMSKDNVVDDNLLKKITTRQELFNSKSKYTLFTAFSILPDVTSSDKDQNTFVRFVKELNDILKIKNISFFKSNEMAVMVYKTNSYKSINRVKIKVRKKLDKVKHKSSINNFYDGITYVECEGIENEKEFSKIMTRISFGLIKSKLTKEPVMFTTKNIKFNEFEEFKEKIMLINNLIETSSFEFNVVPVNSVKSNKHIHNFYYPKFELPEDYWNDYIIQINEFDNKIKDKFVDNMIHSNIKGTKKIMLNINDYNIEEKFDLMKKMDNYIFIVNQVKYKDIDSFIGLLKLLELSNIKYGVFINDVDSNALSIISNAKPKLIVVSNKFNLNLENIKDLKNKMRVMNIIKVTEKLKITLMFTNVNKQMKNEIKKLSKTEKLYVEYDFDF